MLGSNIRNFRKTKGFSQEELALRVNVVRQTVSKWEKGLSVPDSDILIKIAEALEVSVSSLLGSDCISVSDNTNEIAAHLERINEQLAIRNRRIKTILKILLGVAIAFAAILIMQILFGMSTGIESKTETFIK